MGTISELDAAISVINTQLKDVYNIEQKDELIRERAVLQEERLISVGSLMYKPKPLTIAVIGDSISTQNYAIGTSWPEKLQTLLLHNGVDAEVRSYSHPGHSFNTARTTQLFGTRTSVEAVVDLEPDVVIVALGVNDTVSASGSANVAAVQLDAVLLFQELRTGLPDAKVYHARELAFDEGNFPGAVGLKNKAILPGWSNFPTTGYNAYKFSPEILEDTLATNMASAFNHWTQLDAYIDAIKNIPTYKIDGIFDFHIWQVGRLGVHATGGIHFTDVGAQLLATDILEGLVTVGAPAVANIRAPNTDWSSVQTIFNNILVPSADGYITKAGWVDNNYGIPIAALGGFSPENWFMPYKGFQECYPRAVTSTGAFSDYFHLQIRGSKPHTQVYASVNGGAAFPYAQSDGTLVVTTGAGDASATSTLGVYGLTAGTWILRFIVGDAIFEPVTIVIS